MFDEARYVLEARRLREQIAWSMREAPALARDPSGALDAARHVLSGGASAPGAVTITAGGMVRPLHAFLLAAAGATETSGLLLVALLGVATVAFAAVLAKSAGRSDAAALFAAFLLATSPAHVFLSRTILAEVPPALLLMAGIIIYINDISIIILLFAGLVFGASLAAQSRMVMILPLVVAWDVAVHRSPRRVAALIAGMALPILVIQAAYLLLKIVFITGGRTDFFQSYLEQFIEMGSVDHGRLALNHPFFALNYMLVVEGVVATLLFGAGVWMSASWRDRRLGFVAALSLWILLLGTLFDPFHHGGPRWGRLLSPAWPLVAVVAAAPLAALWERKRLAAIALCAAMLAEHSALLSESMAMKCDYAAVLTEVYARAPAPAFFSDEPVHVSLHLGPRGVRTEFDPEHETTTVVVFDPAYAGNFGFYYMLPDTPTFTIPDRDHRPSRLQWIESVGVGTQFFLLRAPVVPPASAYVLPLGYESRVHARRPF